MYSHRNESPEKLAQKYLENNLDRIVSETSFNTLVIDEGQDFSEKYWDFFLTEAIQSDMVNVLKHSRNMTNSADLKKILK